MERVLDRQSNYSLLGSAISVTNLYPFSSVIFSVGKGLKGVLLYTLIHICTFVQFKQNARLIALYIPFYDQNTKFPFT